MLLRHIPLQITVFGRKRLRNVLNASQRRVNKNSLTWWYILKTSRRYLCKTSWRCFEDVFKTSWTRLENVLKRSWRRMAKRNILVLIKTSSEEVRLRRTNLSWWRRLEDVLKTSSSRRMFAGEKINYCNLISFYLLIENQ